jgi:AraC-like DNA-binding protein
MEFGSRSGERVVIQLARLLSEAGGDVRAVLAAAAVAMSPVALLRGDLPDIPQERLHRLRGLLTRALADLLAERSGREIVRGPDWRMLFFCLVNSRTLREAIDRGGELIGIMDGRCGRMSMQAGPSRAEVRLDSRWPVADVYTFAVDAVAVAMFVDIFGWLIGRTLPVTSVFMNYPAEMQARFDPEILLKPIVMDADRAGFAFPAEYLDYPVIRTTDECEAGMEKILSTLFDLEAHRTELAPAERARRIMLRSIRDADRIPTLDEISADLGCSRSQLRRWLGRDGISYNDIKESCRRELALDLLRRSPLSIEEISAQLGYYDSDAFRQAFRRWIGISPSEFRKTGQQDRSRTDYGWIAPLPGGAAMGGD